MMKISEKQIPHPVQKTNVVGNDIWGRLEPWRAMRDSALEVGEKSQWGAKRWRDCADPRS